jgi:hypothetical protein
MSAASAPGLSKLSPKSHATPIVFIVDDDISVREWLELLIRSEGWRPEAFESAGFARSPKSACFELPRT